MGTAQKSLRMPEPLAEAITETAEAAGRDFTALATELLSEAVAMWRCPGIAFMDGWGQQSTDDLGSSGSCHHSGPGQPKR